MHSKRRYKICTLTHSFSILQGFQSENFRCSLTYCESENFSDSSLHQIDSESFRYPFLYENNLTWVVKCAKVNFRKSNRKFYTFVCNKLRNWTQIKRSSIVYRKQESGRHLWKCGGRFLCSLRESSSGATSSPGCSGGAQVARR